MILKKSPHLSRMVVNKETSINREKLEITAKLSRFKTNCYTWNGTQMKVSTKYCTQNIQRSRRKWNSCSHTTMFM